MESVKTRGWKSAGIGATIAFLILALLAPAIHASAAESAGQGTRVPYSGPGGQPVADLMLARAAHDPAYRDDVTALVDTWAIDSRGGVSAGDGTQVDVQQLRHDLDATASSSAATAGTNATGQDARAAAPASSDLDPNTFAVGGAASADGFYWQSGTFSIVSGWCDEDGCDPPSDRVDCNVTIDPAAVTSRVSWTCSYFPSTGDFQDKHLELWAVEAGTVVGILDTVDVVDSGVIEAFLDNAYSLKGSVLTIGVALWGYSSAEEGYGVPATFKTSDAICAADAEDNNCYYPS